VSATPYYEEYKRFVELKGSTYARWRSFLELGDHVWRETFNKWLDLTRIMETGLNEGNRTFRDICQTGATGAAFGAGGAALKTEQQLSNPFDFNFNLV
jgi:hypothetical protein